jgi:hypothetical protein
MPEAVLLLRADPTKRFLLNGNNQPILVVGDSPHVVLQQLNSNDQTTYFGNLQTKGYNACWVDIFGDTYFFNGRSDWGLLDGTDPFTTTLDGANYDFTAPSSTFFAAVDAMLTRAAAAGIIVFLNCFDPAGVMATWTANGTTRVQSLGTFLGTRYKNTPNIVWFMGNDFQTWSSVPADTTLCKSFLDALLAADPNHLLMTQMDYPSSGSLYNTTLAPVTSLTGAYCYYPCYSQVRGEYESATKTVPTLLQETWYTVHTFQGNGTTLPPSDLVLRHQAWWSTLAGAKGGYLSGNGLTDGFNTGWQTAFTATWADQLMIWATFIKSIPWTTLTYFDWSFAIGTAGRGTYVPVNTNDNVDNSDYVTLASDGSSGCSLVVAYCPKATTLTIDMTKLRGTVTARWFDPTNGTYTSIGSFANTGTHNFVTIGNNNAGSVDWILRLDA